MVGDQACRLPAKAQRGLAALVREEMKSDPFSGGGVRVSAPSAPDRVKLVYWDGTGVCLFAKRLEDGKFQLAECTKTASFRLSAAQPLGLVGKDWIGERVHANARDAGADAAGMIAAE